MKIPQILLEKAEELETYYKAVCPDMAPFVKQCFLNTIETTAKQLEDGSYFVITGDIPAMWLRDSAAQVRHYVRYAREDKELQEILEGVIQKQAELVAIDPYANAFNESADGRGHQDITQLNPRVWERKYETDSLCAPLYLAYHYWKETNRENIFTDGFLTMLKLILKVFRTEQNHESSPYSFQRQNCAKTDTLINQGKGRPVNYTGMTWSGFRPSDDCCKFGYLIPANMMAVVALTYGAEIVREVYKDSELAAEYTGLAEEIQDGISDYGIVEKGGSGRIYAYETDGFGNYNLMDDANSPSLLAMPYLNYCSRDDELYKNTRRFVLSRENPYYSSGSFAAGIGSPHTPKGMVWHIGIIMQALTSDSEEEIRSCLSMLSATHDKTYFMHEAFHPDNPGEYTRPWFAWANSLLAELLITLKEKNFFGSV